MKRKDECLFCNSRSCYERVLGIGSCEYDEIACMNHIKELHKDSDKVIGMKSFISSTGKMKRGKNFWRMGSKGDR